MIPGQFGQLSLASLFEWVDSGELALPELQRPAVWQDSMIPDLLDSVYRDFPFGTMLVWTPSTGDPIRTRRFRFAENDSASTVQPATHFLIDGQQRLTSFYRALSKTVSASRDIRLPVAFHVEDERFSLVDGQVRSMLQDPKKHGWYRIRDLMQMQPSELQEVKRWSRLSDGTFQSILGETGRIRRLQAERISIPVFNIGGRSYAEAVEIFDRINRGTRVKESQKVLAALSAMCPGIVGEVEEYLEASAEQHGGDFDLDFFIGSLALVAREYVEIEPLAGHYENEYEESDRLAAIQEDVRVTMQSIGRATEFLDAFLGMNSLRYIPYVRSLKCLAYAFAKGAIREGNENDARHAADWMVRSLLSGYHDDSTRFKRDIAALREAEAGLPVAELNANLLSFGAEREIKFQLSRLSDIESAISRNDALFSFLFAVLRKSEAVSFPSGRSMRAARPEMDANEKVADANASDIRGPTLHRHHIYPLGRLHAELDVGGDKWLTKAWMHDIANFTFILSDDNLDIGDGSIEYLRAIDPAARMQHMIGLRDYKPGDYKHFLKDRRKLMRQALLQYVDDLRADSPRLRVGKQL